MKEYSKIKNNSNRLAIQMIDIVLMVLKRIVRQKIPIEQMIIDLKKSQEVIKNLK